MNQFPKPYNTQRLLGNINDWLSEQMNKHEWMNELTNKLNNELQMKWSMIH